MRIFEVKYLLEQAMSSVDRLTDILGKQTDQIQELWGEIHEKNKKVLRQQLIISELKEKLATREAIIKCQVEKSIKEIDSPESINN